MGMPEVRHANYTIAQMQCHIRSMNSVLQHSSAVNAQSPF